MGNARAERKRNRGATEIALILAASNLFAAKGFEAATTREIAAKAGCAEGLIHRYFSGKEGLLLAIVRHRASNDAVELAEYAWPTATVEDELVQLVEWEVDRAWRDREFLKVVVRQAMVDSSLAEIIKTIGLGERNKLIKERLSRFKDCRQLPAVELEALVNFVISTGFMFGFMRPVVLCQDRAQTARTASVIARILGRSLASSSFSLDTFQSLPSLT